MGKHARLRAQLETAFKLRPSAPPKGRTRVPQPPTAAEMAYRAAMRKVMRDVAAAVKPEITALADLVGTRADAKEPSSAVRRALDRLRASVTRAITRSIEAGIIEDVGAQMNAANVRELSRVTGMDRRVLAPNLPLDEWTRENVELIRSIGTQYLGQVEELVVEAVDTGVRHEVLAAQLAERLQVTESRAQLIARDQVLRGNADLSEARMRRVGVTKYIWRATPDDRTRDDHKALDGNTYTFADPPIVDKRSGRRANPGGDIQCRCQAEPVFDDDEP
jgi:SPP1 gp7 family putative phage head morphogenesis protein